MLLSTAQSQPQPSTANIPATIGISASITIGVSVFVVKWMFERLIAGFDKRLADLESTNQAQVSRREFDVLDTRFTAIGTSFSSLQGNYQELQKEIIKLRGEYLPREDWVRLSSGLESKLETLGLQVQRSVSGVRSEIEGRSKSIDERLEMTRTGMGEMRNQIATEYVRREDWVRFVTTIDAKMDGIMSRMDEKFDRLSEKMDRRQ